MKFLIICDAIKRYIDDRQAENIATLVSRFKEANKESGYYIIFINSIIESGDEDFDSELEPTVLGTEDAELPAAILGCIRPDNTSLSWRKRLSPFNEGNPCVWEIMDGIHSHLNESGEEITHVSFLFCTDNKVTNDAVVHGFKEKIEDWDEASEIKIGKTMARWI